MILSLIGALVIGITLGLMGSGGSILTLPLLVYLLGREGDIAIAESLAIVGGIAAFGVIPHARKHLVEWRTALIFGLPGMAGAFLGAIVGAWMDNTVQLILFAIVMLGAATFMFRKSKRGSDTGAPDTAEGRPSPVLVGIQGLIVGVMTGIVGVGGGFLIVPALVLLGKLPIHRAVATSLLVIAANSAVAFTRYTIGLSAEGLHVDWGIIGMFIAVGAGGTFVGKALGGRISQATLRRIFAVFLVVMGIVIISRESVKLLSAPSNVDPSDASAVD
ncbi:MAG: sulfite exporter TauE/SafE family protein [Phycisphaera sp.]|nr:sulfite exporter TauE/SafE family protein [Phycisphaera sp.]